MLFADGQDADTAKVLTDEVLSTLSPCGLLLGGTEAIGQEVGNLDDCCEAPALHRLGEDVALIGLDQQATLHQHLVKGDAALHAVDGCHL